MRVLHCSDVHVDLPFAELPTGELFNKRLLGLANLWLRRGARFAQSRKKLEQLAAFVEREGIDLVINTGDYTAVGTEPELRAAREAIDGLTHAPLGFVTVPGNHDLYMPDTVQDGRFERTFGDLLGSDWPERTVDGLYPSVRLIGDDVAVVGVNSARPNPQPWRSSGRIPDEQIARLSGLLEDAELQRRFVFLITHYALRRRDGSKDEWTHGMENAEELMAACASLTRGAFLHGHIHHRYHLRIPGLYVPSFGAGSATDQGREGIWVFELGGTENNAIPGGYQDGGYRLQRDPALTW